MYFYILTKKDNFFDNFFWRIFNFSHDGEVKNFFVIESFKYVLFENSIWIYNQSL